MTMAASSSGSIVDRAVRAARLDINTYEEVEADVGATSQALTVVAITSIASGIGGAIGAAMHPVANRPAAPVGGFIAGILTDLIGWAVWAWVMYFVGTRFFKGQATWGEVLRTTGFAYAPGILLILQFVPFLGGLIGLIVAIWRLVTSFIAVRQALDISNGATVATIVVGFIGFIIVAAVVGTILALIGLGTGALLGSPL